MDDLARVRMAAMTVFLEDYDTGKANGRYVDAEMPTLPFGDHAFHLSAIKEMSRVAAEVRIFPLLTLSGEPSRFVDVARQHLLECGYEVTMEAVAYEFQRGGNRMMRIRAN